MNFHQLSLLLDNKNLKFFHGTTTKLNIGEDLLPPSITGVEYRSHPDIDPSEFENYNYIYLTLDLNRAQQYGSDKAKKGEKVYVYEVEPSTDIEKDPEGPYTSILDDYRCSKAKIKKIVSVFENK